MPDAFTRAVHQPGWVGRGESLPTGSTLDLISDKPNRWNAEGEPTIYVSGDPALALVECGRHPADLEDAVRLFETGLRIPRALDLRDPTIRAELSLPSDAHWVLDRETTREIARSLRRSGRCDALIVPSAGALDEPERCNIVVFADDPAKIPDLITDLRLIGDIRLGAVGT